MDQKLTKFQGLEIEYRTSKHPKSTWGYFFSLFLSFLPFGRKC